MMIQSPASGGATKTLYRSGDRSATPVSAPVARLRTPSRVFGKNGPGSNGASNGHATSNGSRRKQTKKSNLWSPWKVMMLSILLGIAGSLYLTHVFQTQNTLREVQQLRRDYERAQRVNTDIRRNYDRMTGPVEVYRQAEQFGMISGGAADPVIILD